MAIAAEIGYSSSPFPYFRLNTHAKLRLSQFVNQRSVAYLTNYGKDKSHQYIRGVPKLKAMLLIPQTVLVGSGDRLPISGPQGAPKDIFPIGNSCFHISRNDGKRGTVSFCTRDNEVISSNSKRTQNSMSWFIGPAALATSFIYPQLILPEVIPDIFGHSISLTIFLLLFFTDAIFYCGVAVFLLILDHLMRPKQLDASANNSNTLTPQLGHRISSVTTLVVLRQLSITISMVTMGLTWPWTGPAVPATLAPYLVGIFVQFAFEQLAGYWKSPSSDAIPFIFHAYRLHQIHRAATWLTVLSFENYSKLPVTSDSLLTLSNVLRFLIVICIWSFSSFLMRFLPSASATMQ